MNDANAPAGTTIHPRGKNDAASESPNLIDRRVVILGGTGAVGEGIVRAWIASGAEVIVPSRSPERIAELRQHLGSAADTPRLRFVLAPHTDFMGAEQSASDIIEQFGAVTDVVASIGGWWQGTALWEITQQEWETIFVGFTTAHVAQVRAWIPRLTPGGSYQLILGGSATRPVPGSAMINMEQAALLMMRRVLAAEVGTQGRISSVVLGPVNARQRSWVDPAWVSNDEVGLVTTAVAAAQTHAGRDVTLRTKDDVEAFLRELDFLPPNAQQVRTEQHGLEQHGLEQHGLEQHEAEHNGADQDGAEA